MRQLYYLISFGLFIVTNGEECTVIRENCFGANCSEKVNCIYGSCQENVKCNCLPCFSGQTCDTYYDDHKPHMEMSSDEVFVRPSANAEVIYHVSAFDEDFGEKCIAYITCPCADFYFILRNGTAEFTLDSTGDISIRKGVTLIPGETYLLLVSLMKNGTIYGQEYGSVQSEMTLKVICLHVNNTDDNINGEISDSKEINLSDRNVHQRTKRNTFVHTDAIANVTLSMGADPGILKRGFGTTFTLNIVLAARSSDIKIKIMTKDLNTSLSNLAIWRPRVTAFGANLRSRLFRREKFAKLKPTLSYADNISIFVDVVDFDFGTVTNNDVFLEEPPYDNSTIIIEFGILLTNATAYTSVNTGVLVGVEYGANEYIWVAEALFQYENNEPVTTYKQVTVTGPDSLPKYNGALYELSVYLCCAFTTIYFEVAVVSYEHDKVSIENVQLTRKGERTNVFEFADIEPIYRKSVTDKTNHFAKFTFTSILWISTEVSGEEIIGDDRYEYIISFSAFALNADAGEVFGLVVLLQDAENSIWSEEIALLITAEGESIIESPLVDGELFSKLNYSLYQPKVYGLRFPLGKNNNQISCRTNTDGKDIVTGVMFGDSGRYVSRFPDLRDIVVYADNGSASWKFFLNLTVNEVNHVVDENATFALLLFSVLNTNPGLHYMSVECYEGGSFIFGYDAYGSGTLNNDITAEIVLPQNNTLWYPGSVVALTTRFNFKGTAYANLIYESLLDIDENSFGAEICKVEIINVGVGVASILRTASTLNNSLLFGSSGVLQYNDMVNFTIETMGASDLIDHKHSDFDVDIKVYYDLPLGQETPNAIVPGNYNILSAMHLSENVIWVGDGEFAITDGFPEFSAENRPLVTFYKFEEYGNQISQCQMMMVNIKIPPSQISANQIIMESKSNALICGVAIMSIGKNLACVQKEFLGKENDPRQKIKIYYDTVNVWSSMYLDLGTIRNFGENNYIEYGPAADEDSIQLALLVRAEDILIHDFSVRFRLRSGNYMLHDYTFQFNAEGLLIPPDSLDIFIIAPYAIDAYYGVLSTLNIELDVPKKYSRRVKLVARADTAYFTEICYIAVVKSGQNVPCVVQSTTSMSTVEVSETGSNITLDLATVTYFPIRPKDNKHNRIHINIGFRLTEDQPKGRITLALLEEGSTTSEARIFVNNLGIYPSVVIKDTEVYALSKTNATTVRPGDRLWLSSTASIPKETTRAMMIGIQTNMNEGRAEATIHGIRIGSELGKNIGCFGKEAMVSNNLTQDQMFDGTPIVHTSQTNLLLTEQIYVTNTGTTYLRRDAKAEDDTFLIEADILIADHNNLKNGSEFNVYFFLKYEEKIIIIQSIALIMFRDGMEMPSIISSIFLLDNPADYYESKSTIDFGVTMEHNMNESKVEVYDAVVMVCLPKFITYVAQGDANYTNDMSIGKYASNIPAILKQGTCIDFNISYLFFTDKLNLNISVSVDSYGILPMGIGIINAPAVLRLFGKKGDSNLTGEYIMEPMMVSYAVEATDQYDDLNVHLYEACHFTASSAVDETSDAAMAASLSGKGWLPAALPSTTSTHQIYIDFHQLARVTKILLIQPDGWYWRIPDTFRLKASTDGTKFEEVCNVDIPNDNNTLPLECRFESHFAMIEVKISYTATITQSFGFKFKWFGKYMDDNTTSCPTSLPPTLYTSSLKWGHILYDEVHNRLYFCYYKFVRKDTQCWSTVDGNKINAAHPLIKSLAGFDRFTQMVFGYAGDRNRTLATVDGISWMVLATSKIPITYDITPQSITGNTPNFFDAIEPGGNWTVEFNGIYKDGILKIHSGA